MRPDSPVVLAGDTGTKPTLLGDTAVSVQEPPATVTAPVQTTRISTDVVEPEGTDHSGTTLPTQAIGSETRWDLVMHTLPRGTSNVTAWVDDVRVPAVNLLEGGTVAQFEVEHQDRPRHIRLFANGQKCREHYVRFTSPSVTLTC